PISGDVGQKRWLDSGSACGEIPSGITAGRKCDLRGLRPHADGRNSATQCRGCTALSAAVNPLSCRVIPAPAYALAPHGWPAPVAGSAPARIRSEEHTSELQSRENLV